jgi:glutamate-1-semialdehyde 2,1-aminomutase
MLERALKTIPLGSQTFSKSMIQYPVGVSPLFLERGEGSRVWDIDGNSYIDFVNGLLSVSIGYNNPIINAAVLEQLNNGVTFSLPHRLETEVAEMLVDMVPCAEMVRFGKNGSDATSAAVRLARAYTDREHILVCGYHGWQDWYIGSTTRDLGVPEAVKNLTHKFQYNNIDSLNELFEKYKDKIAGVIMEPMNIAWPENYFLSEVKNICHKNGAVLIFDETITGCRFANGGAQELFGVTPDLATFGKGLANGLPLSAVLGRRDIMNKMEGIFFSGTFGGETLSLAAAKAVLTLIRDKGVVKQIEDKGNLLLNSLNKLIQENNAESIFNISGHPSWSFFNIEETDECLSWSLYTLYLQEMFERGILILGSHNISFSHTDEDIEYLLSVYADVIPLIINAINHNKVDSLLKTNPLKPIFKVR